MDLRSYITSIGETYDRLTGLSAPAQTLLRDAPQEVGYLARAGYVVIGSGGKGTATFTPWFGFFDPDETSRPEDGLYVCYLFSADLQDISLTVMQGITTLDRQLGRRAARDRLAQDGAAIRHAIPQAELVGLDETIQLRSAGFRQLAYEAGCVVSQTYSLPGLPHGETLHRDFERFLNLHQVTIRAKRSLLQRSPGAVATASAEQHTEGDDPLRSFKPKDDSDYVSHLQGRTLIKTCWAPALDSPIW